MFGYHSARSFALGCAMLAIFSNIDIIH